MKIYVISLENDHERKAALLSRFPKNYPEFIFINAVDGRKLSTTEYFNLIKPNLYIHNRLLSPAEVGCALSHMQVLQMIVESNEPAIILEDDVIGDDQHLEIAKTISTIIQHDEVIFLGGYDHIVEKNKIYLKRTNATPFANPIFEIDNYSHIYLGSTCCYAVGVNAAKKILASQQDILKLADNWYKHALNTTICFKFTQLLHHPVLSQVALNNSVIDLQRKSINYKKTHTLFLESILLNFKLKFFLIMNIIKSKFASKKISTLKKIFQSKLSDL